MQIGTYALNSDYVVGWGTLAFINAGLAQGKNRSGLNWFLLSILLGPLATFILVLLGKLSRLPAEGAPQRGSAADHG